MKSCKDVSAEPFDQREQFCSIKEILMRCPIECGSERKEKMELLQSQPKSNNCTWLEQNNEKNKWCAGLWVQMECKEICNKLATRIIYQTQYSGE